MNAEHPYLRLYGMLLSQLLFFALLFSSMLLKERSLLPWCIMALILHGLLLCGLFGCFHRYRARKVENRRIRRRQCVEENYLRSHEATAASLEEIRAEIEKQIDRFPALSELSLMQRNVVISQLLEEYSRLCSMELCENTLIDAVIFSKKTRADAFGIHMSCALALPERIAVSPVDLISVFANLLDNAIEGSLLMPPEKRMILVSAAVKADCLIVTVANHKPASLHVRTEGMASSKGEGHGLGLGILRQIAERYDGSFSCEDSGERVEFSIMLPLLESCTER